MITIIFEEISDRLPAEAMRRRDVPAGTSLFLRGDPVRSVHFVQAGLAELVRHTPDGKPAILQRAGPGEMLAEASVFPRTTIATQRRRRLRPSSPSPAPSFSSFSRQMRPLRPDG